MGTKLPTNLPQLQNLIKRDPESYREEFESQYVYYVDAKEIFKLTPSVKDTQFYELVMFIAQVVQCYPDDEDIHEFPNDIVGLLRTHGPVMHPEIRIGLVKALILMRNKDLLPPMLLLDVCFDLLRCQDKALRTLLQEHIVTDIKNINAKSKNMVLNRKLQDFLNNKLSENHAVAVKTALDVMIALYRKGVWRDKRTVNIIASACYSRVAKIMVAAIKFFVGNDEGQVEETSDSESENDAPNVKKALLAMRVNKKTKKKRQSKVEKVKKAANENKKKKNIKLSFDFSALHLIHDPQTVAEQIFKIFNKRNERFEVKLLMMNMVSRLIGIHQLYLPNFFPTLQRFLYPHQREVTKVMVYAAQAAHALMSPDDLQPVVRSLADNFVTERYSAEVMAMGLNAIRELCNRNEHAMDEDLLQDLVEYRNHKDKGVYMAARSLMVLYREKNAQMLARKTRGVPTELIREELATQFGEYSAKDYIPGAEILAFQTNTEDFIAEDSCDSDEKVDEAEDVEDENELGEVTMEVNEAVSTVDKEDSESEEYDSDCDGDGEDDGESGEENREIEIKLEEIKNTQLSNAQMKNEKNKVAHIKNTNAEEKNRGNEDKVFSKSQAIREILKLTPQERAAMAADIVSSRLLTDADFAKIDAVRAVKQVERFKSKKRRLEETKDDARDIVPLSSIEMVYKKRRHDKATRMAAVLDGRTDREKFGSRKGRSNPHASTTNREKTKSKNYDMVKHKKRFIKQKSSFRDKKARLKQSMLRQLKNT